MPSLAAFVFGWLHVSVRMRACVCLLVGLCARVVVVSRCLPVASCVAPSATCGALGGPLQPPRWR
jgi:hypothetical protein